MSRGTEGVKGHSPMNHLLQGFTPNLGELGIVIFDCLQ